MYLIFDSGKKKSVKEKKENWLNMKIPPTNGWIAELVYQSSNGNEQAFECGYRIYILGDTLMVDERTHINLKFGKAEHLMP